VGQAPGKVTITGVVSRFSRRHAKHCLVFLDMTKKGRNGELVNTNKSTKAFLVWLNEISDPLERYRRATEELERHRRAVARISMARARAAADAYEDGRSVRALAERFGLSPARVHQLIADARDGQSEP
jgi:DNA-directed RNA polymerase specialized sigma24 family protein